MELERIMEAAREQEHWAKSPDLRHLMEHLAGDGFEQAMRKVVEAKRDIVSLLGLDEHGRRFFDAPKASLAEVVAGLDSTSWLFKAYFALTNAVYSRVQARGDIADLRHGEAIYDWARAPQWGDTADALAYSVAGADTLMLDVGKRRMRLPKVLLASGIDAEFFAERRYWDWLPQRDKYASYMDLINLVVDGLRRQQAARLMVSANPLDLYLCSSDQYGYISCYNPYSIHYPGGSWQYMMNRDSVVLYHLKSDEAEAFPYRKVGRVWVLAKDGHVIAGRGYGTLQHNARMGEHIARTVGGWAWGAPMHGVTNPRSRRSMYSGFSAAYFDEETISAFQVGFGPAMEEWHYMKHVPTFSFPQPVCPGCGEQYEGRSGKDHNRCDSCLYNYAYECYDCASGILDGDQYQWYGDYYCSSCYHSHTSECESCGERVANDDMAAVTLWRYGSRYTEHWCEDCRDDCSQCENCNRTTPNDDAVTRYVVDSESHVRADGHRVRRPQVREQLWCEPCAITTRSTECIECERGFVSVTSAFPALIELRVLNDLGRQDTDTMCRDCAREDYNAVHSDGHFWTPEALGEHRLEEMLLTIFANESPAIRHDLTEVM